MRFGIDLSEHNGNVDMSKVKASGIDFAILRMAYGKNKTQIDKQFYNNYNKTLEYKIPIGVYIYSYAISKEDALQEAKLTLDLLKDIKIEYPVFIDMEDFDGYKKRNNVSNFTCVDICETFCKYIEENGYYVGIYANLDWLNNKINSNKLDRFDKWVAEWGRSCHYKKEYGMWQYSSKGIIPGINGNVDLNYALKDYPSIINNTKKNNNIYIVQNGDNLSKIAQKYNINLKKIYQWNKSVIGNDPNLIYEGQALVIKEE